MTDDDFVFGDDSDDDGDGEVLFGARTDDDSNAATDTDRRFGTSAPDDNDSRKFAYRIRTAVSGATSRTAMTALVLACVVVIGLVAYPLVMGALDTGDNPAKSGTQDGNVGGTLTTTARTTGATGMSETKTATTNVPISTPTTALPSTTAISAGTAATASPTTEATPTPTPVPERGFPAGTPVETNETSDENAQSAA